MQAIIDNNIAGRHIRDARGGALARDLLASEDVTVGVASGQSGSGTQVQVTIKDAVVDENTNAVALTTFNLGVSAPLARLAGRITYASSNPSVATVDANGNVTPVAPGSVIVTVTIPGYNPHKIPLTIQQNTGQTTFTFVQWAAGSLGAHRAAQITALIGSTPNPNTGLATVTDPPDRTTYGNLYMFNVNGTRNSGVWTGTLDTSCIATNAPATLIAPDIAVWATHVGFPSGNLTFMDMAGGTHTTTIVGQQHPVAGLSGDGDITLVKLSPALPSGIKPASLLPANYLSFLPSPQYGYPALFTNQDRTLLLADVFQFDARSGQDIAVFQSNDPIRSRWYYPIRLFDSGNPCFTLINGALVLVTLWHYAGQYGPRYSDNLAPINAAMTALGSAHQASTSDLSAFSTY